MICSCWASELVRSAVFPECQQVKFASREVYLFLQNSVLRGTENTYYGNLIMLVMDGKITRSWLNKISATVSTFLSLYSLQFTSCWWACVVMYDLCLILKCLYFSFFLPFEAFLLSCHHAQWEEVRTGMPFQPGMQWRGREMTTALPLLGLLFLRLLWIDLNSKLCTCEHRITILSTLSAVAFCFQRK